MNFIDRNFTPLIFKIINNKVFSSDNSEIDIIELITAGETFKNLFNIIDIQDDTYFCHIIPIFNNQAIVIALKQKNNDDITTNMILSYRVANIILQRFETIQLYQIIQLKKPISCKNIIIKIEGSIHNTFSNDTTKLSSSDYIFIRPVAASCTSETIGHILGKSHRTCEDRIKSLYKKFKCQSRRELSELCNYIIITSQQYTLIPLSGHQIKF